MADSFLDTAGGLQQVPTVDIVEKPAQPYVATDGSMQSALAVNVGAGGEIIEDGDPVTVKPANGVSPTYQGTFAHGTPPVITLPATVALVPDAATTALLTHAGTNAGSITMHVNEGALTNASLADQTAVVSDQADVILSKADNTGLLAMLKANVPGATDLLESVALPATYAVIQDGVGDFDVTDFGAGGGQVAVIARVSGNEPGVQLANATSKIAINAVPITIADQGGKTAPATIAVDQGSWQNFPLTNATDAIVSDQQALTVPVTGTYVDTATLTVANGVITGIVLS